MSPDWCSVCCTRHLRQGRCPGELRATGPERPAWRVNVQTAIGVEAYGVLVAEADDVWRARILTYPNVLWAIPGGTGTLKFVGRSEREAERRAIEFIREHCRERGIRMRDEIAVSGEPVAPRVPLVAKKPAERKVRFLPVRFGVVEPTEPGGTGNLSESGLFVITDAPPPAGTELKLLLNIDKDPISLHGAVRWMRRQPHAGRVPGMGVKLHRPPPRYVGYVRALG